MTFTHFQSITSEHALSTVLYIKTIVETIRITEKIRLHRIINESQHKQCDQINAL